MATGAAASGASGSGMKSQRLANQRKVMDEATRRRRARKALESLEQDNFHDDPHADLVMSKKALNLFQDDDLQASSGRSGRRKTRTAEYYRQRFRKNFSQLLEEDSILQENDNDREAANGAGGAVSLADSAPVAGAASDQTSSGSALHHPDRRGVAGPQRGDGQAQKKAKPPLNYMGAQAPPSRFPARHFCATCGFPSSYCCVVCGSQFCSIPCQEVHFETRCMKYTA